MDIVLYAITAVLYGSLAVAAWAVQRGVAPATGFDAPTHPKRMPFASRAVLLAALVTHGVLLHATIFPAHAMIFGFAFALSAMLWLGAGIYWIESFFFPLDGLRLFVMPLACIASLLPLMFGGVRVLSYAADPLFKIHFLIANIAYGLLALAALHALLMLLSERRLHALGNSRGFRSGAAAVSGMPETPGVPGRLGNLLDTLPPLLTLERLLFRLIVASFVLLTLTLVSGILFSEQLLQRAITLDHKTVFAYLSWAILGAVVIGRRLYGWRGRALLRWVLASFVALLFAYVGSRFVFEVLLHRPVV